MDIFERVQKLIGEQGITIKQLERECELANATIRRWQTQTPNIESVRRVAQRLNTTIDYLVTGRNSEPLNSRFEIYCDGTPLTELEADLVAMFRLLDNRDQEYAFDNIVMLYEKATGEKMSTYSTYTSTKEQQKSGSDEGENTAHETA